MIVEDVLKDLIVPNTEGTRKICCNQAEELYRVGKRYQIALEISKDQKLFHLGRSQLN